MGFFGGGKDNTDFGDVAAAQGEDNRQVVLDQLYANRPNSYTPFGYTNWTTEQVPDGQGGFTQQWSQTTGLTPELQDIYNKQVAIQGGKADITGGLMGRMQNEFGTEMDWRGLNPMGQTPTNQFTLPENSVGDPNAFRQRGEDAAYNSAMSRIQPQFDSQRQALEIKMRNQGLSPGDEAYQSQMESLGQQENDAKMQAQWGASAQGREESALNYGQQFDRNAQNFGQALGANNQNWNQALQGSQYSNQIRQQQLTEAMTKRGFSLNEINALMSGGQVGLPQMPNFTPATAAQPTPIMEGAAQQASIDNANSPWGALLGAGTTLGAAGIGTL